MIFEGFGVPRGERARAKFSAPFRGIVIGGEVELLGKRGGYSFSSKQEQEERQTERGRGTAEKRRKNTKQNRTQKNTRHHGREESRKQTKKK